MKTCLLAILLVASSVGKAQHTFSIVAVDSLTGEIGSAGATCGDSIVWPGSIGAIIISDIIPGVGAIHTQSYHQSINQRNANERMDLGESPQEIISWLVDNDVSSTPSYRQYGIVDYNDGNPRSAAYTGSDCLTYKNHILGANYAIQGNILLGQQILDSMESRFNNTESCLSDKLMAALQGANVVGADSRCSFDGTSSLSAFIRLAKPNDHPDSLFLDLNIAATPINVEPIDRLQEKYDNWKTNSSHSCSLLNSIKETDLAEIQIFPNPTDGDLHIKSLNRKITQIVITDMLGRQRTEYIDLQPQQMRVFSISPSVSGLYMLAFFENGTLLATEKIMYYGIR